MKSNCSTVSFRCFISFVSVVFLLAVFITFGGSALYADTFTVDNWDDSGPGSLRAAIASADSYDDVISFDVKGTITLSSQLKINKSMKIQGPGADLLAVSGGGVCRVFYIEDTAESVDISGISIVSGYSDIAGYSWGGGIRNRSGNLTVDSCHFSGNHACGNGGGMYNAVSRPTVTNCTFYLNSATSQGGGMYNDESSPTVTNCTFYLNSANSGGGMENYYNSRSTVTNCTFYLNSANTGGGMNNLVESSPTVTNCTFYLNSATNQGGGMCNGEDSRPTVTDCTFYLNSANSGGGMENDHNCDPTVMNCTFYLNSASSYGGGMDNTLFSSPEVINCTFSSNSASQGGGMCNEDGSSPEVTNCIFWDGGNEISNNNFSSSTLSYCVVQSYDQGVSTVTSADPMLQPLADKGGPTWTCALELGSSAIDAGITISEVVSTDQRGIVRPQGVSFDIGAYELKSYLLTTVCNKGGCIIPESADVFEGESMDIYIFPDSGYEIDGVYLDGEPVSYDNANCCFTFQNLPSDDHILQVVFEPDGDDGDSDDDDDDDDNIPDDDDNIPDDDDDSGDDVNGGGGGGGCSISTLPGIALLLLVPMMFLSGKMK